MKKTTSILKTLFILLFAVMSLQINAQYISVPGSSLSYEDPATWQGENTPACEWCNLEWPGSPIEISANSEVIRTGNLHGKAGVTNIYGYFKVTGEFNSNNENTIYVRSGGVLEVGSLNSEAPIVVEEGGVLIVENDFSHSNKSIIVNGEIIVSGEFSSTGNINIGNTGTFTVDGIFHHKGGSPLLVNGSLKIEDNFVLSVDTYVGSNGTITVGGTFEQNGGKLDIEGGVVEIFDEYLSGRDIKVTDNGSLVIHKSMVHDGGNLQISDGLVIIKGDYSTKNTIINVDGTMILGGDLVREGGNMQLDKSNSEDNEDGKLYMTKNPPATVTDTNNNKGLPKDYGYGDLDDLLAEKGDNENIMDWLGKLDMASSQRKWTGEADDNDWFNKDNWLPKLLPNSNSEVLIQTGSPFIDNKGELIRVDEIKIENGASLTLKSGNVLEVNEDFRNDGGEFIIENSYGENGLSSFLPYGGMSGDVTIRFTIPTNQWFYISTPLREPTKEAIGSEVKSPYKPYIYSYNTKTKAWVKDPTSIQKAEGNLVYYESESESEIMIEYSGRINNGLVPKTVNGKGYYLFGNPYTSPLNWQDGGWELGKVYGTIWYRTRVNKDLAFVTYNRDAKEGARAALYPDGSKRDDEEELALIPPYQSVWIHSKTSTEENPFTLEIKPGFQKNNDSAPTLKSSGIVEERPSNIIRIVSDNDISRDGAVIYFAENMTTSGEDPGDSYKYFNSSANIPEVYTKAGRQALAINGLPHFEDRFEMPLVVKNRVEGDVTLNFDISLYRSDDVIVLHDKYLDETINLRKTNSYKYTPIVSESEQSDRFVILFNPENYQEEDDDVSTSILDELADGNNSPNINIVSNSGHAIVTINAELLEFGAGRIEVYTVDGKKLSEKEIYSNKTYVVLPQSKGLYIVVVSAAGERKVVKITN